MAYCNTTDLTNKFGADNLVLWADDDDDDTADASVITAAILEADTIINSRLEGIYSVPFSSTPDIIKFISVHLSGYTLYMRLGRAEETYLQGANDAVSMLNDLRAGRMSIPDVSRIAAAYSSTDSDDKVFTIENLEHFLDGAPKSEAEDDELDT